MKKKIFGLIFCFLSMIVSAQTMEELQKLPWKQIATKMPKEWYGTPEAKAIAEKLLLYQSELGGFPKNIAFHGEIRQDVIDKIKETGIGTTIDNNATTTEMRFLTNMYAQTHEQIYRDAFFKALNYIYISQYDNGGWPQFYPYRKGKSVAYSRDITFNDGAIVNVLKLLYAISDDDKPYVIFDFTPEEKAKALEAYKKGIQCILDTQIRNKKGELTVWCAQHDPETLKPAKARAYELESYSGDESADIVLLLMKVENPSPEVIAAVKGAVKWFEEHKITDTKYVRYRDENDKWVAYIEYEKGAKPLWARFYDLETEQPFFCDRDGIKRATLAEVGEERRGGYSWYNDEGNEVLEKYAEWIKKIGK